MAEKLKKEDFVTIFLVQLHLDVVPGVLLMVGMSFLTHKSPILLLSMIDLQRKKKFIKMFFVEIYKEKKIFDDDVLGRASPGCCFRGSSGGWKEKYLLQNL